MLELRRSDEKAIADRLRREAFEHRPPFSQALHERICQAIRECAVGEERGAQRPPPARPALLSVVSCPLSVVRLCATVLACPSGRALGRQRCGGRVHRGRCSADWAGETAWRFRNNENRPGIGRKRWNPGFSR